MALWIKANGEEINVKPNNGKDFELGELQEYVDGYIEILYISGGRIMIINEEGKVKGLPINDKATQMYGFDLIVGNVLVCKKNEVK